MSVRHPAAKSIITRLHLEDHVNDDTALHKVVYRSYAKQLRDDHTTSRSRLTDTNSIVDRILQVRHLNESIRSKQHGAGEDTQEVPSLAWLREKLVNWDELAGTLSGLASVPVNDLFLPSFQAVHQFAQGLDLTADMFARAFVLTCLSFNKVGVYWPASAEAVHCHKLDAWRDATYDFLVVPLVFQDEFSILIIERNSAQDQDAPWVMYRLDVSSREQYCFRVAFNSIKKSVQHKVGRPIETHVLTFPGQSDDPKRRGYDVLFAVRKFIMFRREHTADFVLNTLNGHTTIDIEREIIIKQFAKWWKQVGGCQLLQSARSSGVHLYWREDS